MNVALPVPAARLAACFVVSNCDQRCLLRGVYICIGVAIAHGSGVVLGVTALALVRTHNPS